MDFNIKYNFLAIVSGNFLYAADCLTHMVCVRLSTFRSLGLDIHLACHPDPIIF